uniref:P-type domain-containing protein n=2 Tax=Cuerna arida TaxID=1464854 RepID=A0A1B6EMJ2_9HEMI
MVKAHIVFVPDQAKKYIPPKPNGPDISVLPEPDKRFKLVHPVTPDPFHTTKTLLLYTVLITFILIVFLAAALIFIGPLCNLICNINCISSSQFTINMVCCNEKTYITDTWESEELTPLPQECAVIEDEDRIDCLGQNLHNPCYECMLRNCCWSLPKNGSIQIPHCYYPAEYRSYKITNVSSTDVGNVAYLKIVRNSTYPKNVPLVKIDFKYRTEDILQVKIYDADKTRFQPPFLNLPPDEPRAANNTNYIVDIDTEKMGFRILRKSNNQTIFDTQDFGGFIFSDQLLEISARLPSQHIYGLGQQRNDFKLDMDWNKITLFNHDQRPKTGTNLYGSHPFYLAMEESGDSSGVMLLNSNAMDIDLTPSPGITYRTIGGILDFYIFLGPSPADVVRQFTSLVGRPFLPPYWSLGFHLSRSGYNTLNETKKVWLRTRDAQIPFDTQWNDRDYMKNNNDFTYDKESFHGLPDFVDMLHKEGMHYMVKIDPGISAGELPGTYLPYDEGIAQRVFVSDLSGYRPFIGKVWNKKYTVFVDFFKTSALEYWITQLHSLHQVFAFDGTGLDMNDPTNFLNESWRRCPNISLDYPPYMPAVAGDTLSTRTLCMSAKHQNGITHYNLHNVYALAEAIVTSFSMQQIRNKRAFVVSKSSFLGLGRYAGVWTGDIESSWDDMAHSISDILSFSLFGIPMAGADICGYHGNTTAPLCQRWSQLGAFYPFSRNHNSNKSLDQDPKALGDLVVESARSALLVRYTLLPYLYTLFWMAHINGDTVVRPLFFEFPSDSATFAINSYFMWGPALLIAPVLKKGATEVEIYLPAGRWYDFYSGRTVYNSDTGATLTIPAPSDTIPLLLRGGYIIPTQKPETTTTASRANPGDLLVSLDSKGEAVGYLYWDDGDTKDYVNGVYSLLKFELSSRRLTIEILHWQYFGLSKLANVKILGVGSNVSRVNVNGNKVDFTYQSRSATDFAVLSVNNLNVKLDEKFELTWQETP